MRRWAAGLAVLALAGCESTAERAKQITARGDRAMHQADFLVARADPAIQVLGSSLVQDGNGTAVVVDLRNTGRAAILDAPISIDVLDPRGRSVFRNDLPGSEFALDHVPLLEPGHIVSWVNDQVLPEGTPARATAVVGDGRTAPGALPGIVVSGVHLTVDPVSGDAASGTVRNASAVTQIHLVIFAVARRGRRVVAAGRAILPRLLPGKSLPFHAYFIGNPTGAQISVSAPPSVTS